MGTTQPIRRLEDVQKLKDYFLKKNEIRNYTMVTLGLNTALRISDILNLKWSDVYNFEQCMYRHHVSILEKKTQKYNMFVLNKNAIEALDLLKDSLNCITPDFYIIKSRCGFNKPLGRTRAFTIIKEAAIELNIEGSISCHSLRKTFGYQAWKKGAQPALLMAIYNHSSIEITKRYLSIDQDDKDEVFLNINL